MAEQNLPWHEYGWRLDGNKLVRTDEARTVVATINTAGMTRRDAEMIGRLLEAAPEIHSLLERITSKLVTDGGLSMATPSDYYIQDITLDSGPNAGTPRYVRPGDDDIAASTLRRAWRLVRGVTGDADANRFGG